MKYIIVTGGTSLIGEEIIYKLGAKTNIIFTYILVNTLPRKLIGKTQSTIKMIS